MRRNGWGSCPIYRAKFEIFWNFFEIFMNFLASQRLFSNLNGQIAVSATCRLPVGPPPALSRAAGAFGLTGRAGPCRAAGRAVPACYRSRAVPCRPAGSASGPSTARPVTVAGRAGPCLLQERPCRGLPVWPGPFGHLYTCACRLQYHRGCQLAHMRLSFYQC